MALKSFLSLSHTQTKRNLPPESAKQSMRTSMAGQFQESAYLILTVFLWGKRMFQSNWSFAFVVIASWKQFGCFPLGTYISQWQLHCHRTLKWLISTGHILDFTFWMAAGRCRWVFSQFIGLVFNQALPSLPDKLHIWSQPTLSHRMCFYHSYYSLK